MLCGVEFVVCCEHIESVVCCGPWLPVTSPCLPCSSSPHTGRSRECSNLGRTQIAQKSQYFSSKLLKKIVIEGLLEQLVFVPAYMYW